mgnify:FL=1
MKFNKIIPSILCAAIICTSFTACSPGKKPKIRSAEFSLTAEAETANVELNGDYAKIDFINPGLDTADISVSVFSLAEQKETARVALGNGTWSTGSLENGFFAVDERNKSVRFFGFDGEETFRTEIPTDAKFFAASYVSSDGKYLMYADPETREIRLYEFSGGKTYVAGKFIEKVEAAGYENGSFYIRSGSGCMLSVGVKKKLLITAFDSSDLSLVTKDGGIGFASGAQLFYVNGRHAEKTEKLTRLSKNETPINVIPFGVVTKLSGESTDILRIYEKNTNTLREITAKGCFTDCSADEYNRILTACREDEVFSFGLYDITGIDKQTVKTAAGSESDSSDIKTSEGHIIKNIPVFSQLPDYPTGCETVSTVMALRYAGYNISASRFIDEYLPQSNEFKNINGVNYGPDPKESFVGSPRSAGSYGCFAPVIEKALKAYIGNDGAVAGASGSSLNELCEKYVSKNVPVIIWVSISMQEVYPAEKWTLGDGSTFSWPANEHCMLLIGFDGEYCYLNDPFVGKTVKYDKKLTEKRYCELGKQAVAIK